MPLNNFLRMGAEWAQKQRHEHCTEDVVIEGISLRATTPATSTSIERGAVKEQGQFADFIFRRADLVDIPIRRGTTIVWDGDTYEVVIEGRSTKEFNDPSKLDLIIKTVLRS